MRRADRLFQIIQIMRRHSVTTARRLSEELEVSERTIYRDIRDLISSGVPIEGEAGVGYALSRYYDFPPLMFTKDELEALVLGARIVQSWADSGLATAAEDILTKVEAVLPKQLKNQIKASPLFSLNFDTSQNANKHLELLRSHIGKQKKVFMSYTRGDGCKSERTVRPLCLSFVAPIWLLTGWCELRNDFRNFRIDRIHEIKECEEGFADEPGKTLNDFLRKMNSKQNHDT